MIEPIEHLGWPNCIRLGNGEVELIATTDVGPRIIHFGLARGRNVFKVFDRHAGLVGGREWRIYGGHRLWHAPERKPWTYAPDNEPIEWRAEGEHRLILHQDAHPLTSISKTLDITLAVSRSQITINHRLTYEGEGSIELAPWALTALAPGGTAIVPLPEKGPHAANLLPAGSISLWAYTDLRDSRLEFGPKVLRVHHDSEMREPFKIGLTSHGGWCACLNEGVAFVKMIRPVEGAAYSDLGAQIEVFTDCEMLELETLGPLVKLESGQSAVHEERWMLLRDTPAIIDEAIGEEQFLQYFRGSIASGAG